MHLRVAGYSDTGRVKKTNQDSYLVRVSSTPWGEVSFAAVCDGMGGLQKGELASAAAVRDLSTWFDTKLPVGIETFIGSAESLRECIDGQWRGLMQDINMRLVRYGARNGIDLGTTCTAMLTIGSRYYLVHVGDTRIYEITDDAIEQLTEDQTFIAREIARGALTEEEALKHPQRNVLLQCLGSSRSVKPQTSFGRIRTDASYLVCSDGFRHNVSADELRAALAPSALRKACADRGDDGDDVPTTGDIIAGDASTPMACTLRESLARLAQTVMDRGETDNISAVLLLPEEGDRAC